MEHPTYEMDINTNIIVRIWSITDSENENVKLSNFEADSDGDLILECDGVFITSEERLLLNKAKEITEDEWDLIHTSRLVTPN